MWLHDWKFKVLSPMFAIHWGLQTRRTRPMWRERQNVDNRNLWMNQIRKEMFVAAGKDPDAEAKERRRRVEC
jgi:hypothetical protein